MKIAIVGAGYVGLVTAAGFAEFGNEVTVVDAVEPKIRALEQGRIPFYEPGLEDVVRRNAEARRLSWAVGLSEEILERSEVVFLCVGTPSADDGSADLTALWTVVDGLRSHIPKRPKVVVLKSTVPVGTGVRLRSRLGELSSNWHVANNPEFLREGTAVEDFLRPDRVVVGVDSKHAESVMRQLYEPVANCGPLMVMDSSSAELTKYTSNSMLAMRISFMNEVARMAESVGADAEMVRRGVGADKRIGPSYLYPGPGFGGSCFTKDLAALVYTAAEKGEEMLLAKTTLEVNRLQKHVPVAKLKKLLGGSLKGKQVAVWGLAFKPYTDDIRDSPAIVVVQDLLADGAMVRVHDPQATQNFLKLFPDAGGSLLAGFDNHYDAARDVDGVVLVTEWREYRMPDFMHLKSLAPNLAVVDARNVWREEDARAAGIPYARIGRVSRDL
jgi:UDPglucose 6-dehydrogenase